jgi:hypothetical protein
MNPPTEYQYAPSSYERATHFYRKDDGRECIQEISENHVNSGNVYLRKLSIDDIETQQMFEEYGWSMEDGYLHITKRHLLFEITKSNQFWITDNFNDLSLNLTMPIEYAFTAAMNIINGCESIFDVQKR